MSPRIAITGAAGLVGQNLIPRLKAHGYADIVAIDKHAANTAILRRLHPDITVIEANLAHDDGWQEAIAACDVLVCGHAQIGGIDRIAYEENNVVATKRLVEAVKANPKAYIVHISSSVVESAASDWYTKTKEAQENLVLESGIPCIVLRPTLMFGWFDRKHIGWLARFMQRTPVFPVPGNGRYLRQPLYAGDFCDVVMSCVVHRPNGEAYNISGQEKIAYIDLMRTVRDICGARTAIVRIPYGMFWNLLKLYAIFDRDPPFTTKQLEALVTPDVFEVIDWPAIFGVKATQLRTALEQTFCDPVYSKIVLEF
ncbi:MAG: NAD-dependent epimerase/dehydratase family protein [Bryobacteraceae bacterium]